MTDRVTSPSRSSARAYCRKHAFARLPSSVGLDTRAPGHSTRWRQARYGPHRLAALLRPGDGAVPERGPGSAPDAGGVPVCRRQSRHAKDPTGRASRNFEQWMTAWQAETIGNKLQDTTSVTALLSEFPELDDWVSVFASVYSSVAESVGWGLCRCASEVWGAGRRITYTAEPCGVWVTVWTWWVIPYQAAIQTAIRRSSKGSSVPLTTYWFIDWEFWSSF